MRLSELGWQAWFQDQAGARCGPDEVLARVTAVDRDRYLVRGEAGELPAELTGRFLHEARSGVDLPCVGDWVALRCLDGATHAVIHQVLPRRSFLRRKSPGREIDVQMIAANIDLAFIVQSCHFDFNLRRLERYLVMVREGAIEPLLLLTKTDLVSQEALEQQVAAIRRCGIDTPIIPLSHVTGEGVAQVRSLMAPGKTCCLLGSSGVGKTTLINQLMGGPAALETREVSHTGEGRHTTTRRQLVVLEQGGVLIDMPGMRELGLLAASEGLHESFADIGELSRHCRYANCSHSSEPGCAVREAVDARRLDAGHLQSYQKLSKEAVFHDLSYAEKRKKDKAFGRFIRTVLKDLER